MNKAEILNIILVIAVVFLSVKIAFFSNKSAKAVDAASSEDVVMENIMTRTSIRAYEDRQIEDEKVEKMLQAAMAAPTAGNKQPWKFVVIKDKNTLKTISGHFHTMTMTENAPMAIVVCGDMDLTFPEDGRDYWVEDASAATENLLLAAHSMGLGAVWCGIYPMQDRVKYLSELLKLPENIVPLNVIPVGYPAEDPAPKDKWKPENVHYESWTDKTLAPKTAEVKKWKPLDMKQFRENPFDFFSNALALTVGTKDKMNSMTIGWGGLGVLWGHERPVITVYVEKRRYTHSFMEENEYFTVEAFGPEQQKVLDYLGHVSGRDEDKIKGSGLTVKFTDNGTPMFEEGRLVLECKKLYGAPFNPEGFGELAKKEYSNRPLHSVYIGEIVNAWIKE
jgi:nitroreductase/flavin reductase (DIM6/NTAB) family NADH-FMN oxidoreductase RutF